MRMSSMNGMSKITRYYIPYDNITKDINVYYLRLLHNLEKSDTSSRYIYLGKNKHLDEFFDKVNEIIMNGVDIVN